MQRFIRGFPVANSRTPQTPLSFFLVRLSKRLSPHLVDALVLEILTTNRAH
jgi:hypothetical protein